MLVAGPSARHPDANHRIEFLSLAADSAVDSPVDSTASGPQIRKRL